MTQEPKEKFKAFLKTSLQHVTFLFLIVLALALAMESILAGVVLAAASTLVLPSVRKKYVPENLRHPLLTAVLIIAAFFASSEISHGSQKKQQEMAQMAQAEKEKAIADFASNPQPKIDEIKELIKKEIYAGARNQINYYKGIENEDLKSLDLQLSKIEEKIEAEQQTIAEKAAEKQRLANAAALWSYYHADDPMSKGMTHTASIYSSNTVNFDFPYSGEQNGRLSLRTDPKYGKDIIFSLEKGQILCPSYDGCTVRVRFDDEDATSYSATGAADNSTEIIFIRNYSRFVTKMIKAKRVRISMNIYHEGAPVFDFNVSGFNKEKYQSK